MERPSRTFQSMDSPRRSRKGHETGGGEGPLPALTVVPAQRALTETPRGGQQPLPLQSPGIPSLGLGPRWSQTLRSAVRRTFSSVKPVGLFLGLIDAFLLRLPGSPGLPVPLGLVPAGSREARRRLPGQRVMQARDDSAAFITHGGVQLPRRRRRALQREGRGRRKSTQEKNQA